MRKKRKRLQLTVETVRELNAVSGGVETAPTNSGDAHCPTTAGYPSCDATCTGGGGDTECSSMRAMSCWTDPPPR